MLKSDTPRPNATRGRTNSGSPAFLGCLAGALSVLSVISPATVMADSPSMDPTATPPAYERPIVAANMQCQGVIKVTGGAAQAGPYAEMQARHNAIESWRNQVSAHHGADFTQWWRARDKDVSCQASAGVVHCQALAVPCMAQGGSATMSGLGMGSAGMNGVGMGNHGSGSANVAGQAVGPAVGQAVSQAVGPMGNQPAGVGQAERKR